MQDHLKFLYGKTYMNNSDIDRWLSIDEFSGSISKLVEAGKPINDATILLICERILDENLNSDTICGISREKLSASVVNLRKAIEDFKFKPQWIRERFPEVWKSIKSILDDNEHVIIPTQMGRFIQVLKFISNVGDAGSCDIVSCAVDERGFGYVRIMFRDLIFKGSVSTNELFGRMRFCDEVRITTNDDCVEVMVSVSDIVMLKSEFYSRNRPKRAWILQWNRDLKSNLNNGDDETNGRKI